MNFAFFDALNLMLEYSDGDLSFALVVNLKRENKFRASMWKPVVMHEDTTLELLEDKGSSVSKKILEEVEETDASEK